MSPDTAARLTLALYAAVAAGVIAAQIVRSGIGPAAWFLYGFSRVWTGTQFHWRANRRCPFPPSGGALIIANHRSPVDPQMVWTNHHLGPRGPGPIRIISFMMAREYYEQFGIRWMCRALHAIPVSRDGRDSAPAKETLTRLKSGQLVCIFPEGGINTGDGLRAFDPGVAWLALRAGAPVYPVFIHNAPQRADLVSPFLRPCRASVTYGDPIDLSRWKGDRSRRALEEATALMRERLAELGRSAVRSEGVIPLRAARVV